MGLEVPSWEPLEHTADIGIRARGATINECFEQASRGLLEIAGAWVHKRRDKTQVVLAVTGRDLGAVLVAWLSEVLAVYDTDNYVVSAVFADEVTDHSADGTVAVWPRRGKELPGTQVKAVTFHRLRVEPEEGGWVAEVYLDV